MTAIEHLKKLDPEISRILWQFDGKEAALSHVFQERRGISRQAANGLLSRLVTAGLLAEGSGKRPKTYTQPPLASLEKKYPLESIEEHVVWVEDFRPGFSEVMCENALKIWDYGFTEMLNNAIEHSQGTTVTVRANLHAGGTVCSIEDDGEGIFKRISRICKLPDERQAILELAKGKLTTDPDNHTGEGVFFSSRAFDHFCIVSGGLMFDHLDGEDDYLFERDHSREGTWVMMAHGNHTERLLTDVFDEFAQADEYTFSKTIVPVRLARMGAESLVSRSQAQRLLARVDRFKVVLFDFRDVETVGQAFADEIFRVYANAHPEVELVPVHVSPQVEQMITRATAPRM
ncbi:MULTISPECIES: DUF4325 domain-containing protein [Burkholderia]|uniref:STAS-like domain-containing protein n=1 Tax=Burkholderia TaxID=32008 RepID=UPI00158A3294|nr:MULTISPECIES: DUF4325 domain-containing protein [Burkholderia]MBR8217726.1 DUF4325 domain-containing protein [Burkholderia vietnamiensis]MCA8229006.1 DUF4325 domain-containing protein [Burkholderia vietnamiensis]QMI45067.1 DUF4325 domain-containing protein [Burkholderia sp. MBR-1]